MHNGFIVKKIQRIIYDSCPLCGSKDFIVELKISCAGHPLHSEALPEMMTWQRCQQCDHSFTDGYFGPDGFQELAKKSHAKQVFLSANAEKLRLLCSRIVTNVSNVRNSYSGRWLDIGFGNGALLLTAKEFGYLPTGLDMRNTSIKMLKPYIDDVRNQDFLEVDELGQYDVISMADVLEHVPFPKPFLIHAHQLLKADGVIFISLPNLSAPIWDILTHNNNSNPYWREIEHFHNFSRERLVALLSEHGFEFCHYGISERYRAGMEIIARKSTAPRQ